MCLEWHLRMKASWRQGQIFWLITSNATRAWKHRTLGRGCMWHYYVAVYGQRQALHMVPKLKCGGGGRRGGYMHCTSISPGHQEQSISQVTIFIIVPTQKTQTNTPNLYLHIHSSHLWYYATLVERVYNYLNSITWQLLCPFSPI